VPKSLGNCGDKRLLYKSGKRREFFQQSTKTADRRMANKVAMQIVNSWDHLFKSIEQSLLAVDSEVNKVARTLPFDLSFLGEHEEYVTDLLLGEREYILAARRQPEVIEDRVRAITLGASDILDGECPDDEVGINEFGTTVAYMDFARDLNGLASYVCSQITGYAKGTLRSRAISDAAEAWLLSDDLMTFGQVVERYLVKRKQDVVRLSHVKTQENTINRFADRLPNGFSTPVQAVSGVDANDFADYVCTSWHAYKTRENRLSHVSAVFNYAKKTLKVISTNPFDGYRSMIPKDNKRHILNDRNVAYSDEQLIEVFTELSAYSSGGRSSYTRGLFGACAMALYTGMRMEEVARIEVKDFKESDGIKYLDIDEAKSGAGIRKVPLNRGALLVYSWLISVKQDSSGYIFEGLASYDGRRSKKLSDAFSRFKKSKLKWADKNNEYTFHSFRSCAATKIDQAETPIEYASLILGHEDGRQTLAKKVYSSGKTMRQLQDAAEKIDYGDEVYDLINKYKCL